MLSIGEEVRVIAGCTRSGDTNSKKRCIDIVKPAPEIVTATLEYGILKHLTVPLSNPVALRVVG